MVEKDITKISSYSRILIIGSESSGVVKYFLEPIKENYDKSVILNINTNEAYKNSIDKLKFKPFFNDKWLSVYDIQDRKAILKNNIEKLLLGPSKTYDCICYVSYPYYKKKLANEKWIKNDNIGVFNLTYLPNEVYKNLIFKNLKHQILDPALNLFLKYISMDFHNILTHIDYLNSLDKVITVEDIKMNIEDTRITNIYDYISSMLNEKEKATMKSIANLVDRYGYKNLKKNLKMCFEQLIALKTLMYKGELMEETIFEDVFRLKNDNKLPDILLKLNIRDMKVYVKSILDIPLKHIILYSIIIGKSRDSTDLMILSMLICNKSKWDDDDINYIQRLIRGGYENIR